MQSEVKAEMAEESKEHLRTPKGWSGECHQESQRGNGAA